MPNPSKRKGSAFEREVVLDLQAAGIYAKKVPLSGAVKDGHHDQDVIVRIGALEYKAECKRRKRAFATIDGMLAGNQFLFVRDDRSRPLVVMTQTMLEQLLRLIEWHQGKCI